MAVLSSTTGKFKSSPLPVIYEDSIGYDNTVLLILICSIGIKANRKPDPDISYIKLEQ